MVRLNPKTFAIEGLDRDVFTAAQFDQIERPSCTVCGQLVTIGRIDVTLNAQDEARNGRSYIAGMWECPRGCNPQTGQRFHSSQKFGAVKGVAGFDFECSCGTSETGLTATEFKALAERHPLGMYA